MANVITVTTTELKSKAETLRTKNSSLKTQISNLQQQESSLNGMWDGEANEAFHTAFTNDVTQMNNFVDAIEKYAAALDAIAAQYDKTEATNQNLAANRLYNK